MKRWPILIVGGLLALWGIYVLVMFVTLVIRVFLTHEL